MKKDERFLTDLYQKYYKLMELFAFDVVQDKGIAEDMVQESFIHLIPHAKKLRQMQQSVCVSYLRSTVRHTALNYAIKKEPQRVKNALLEEENLFDIVDESADIEGEVLKTITAEKMKDCIRQLPQVYQDVLNFKYLLELSDREIGDSLGISKNSVRQYLTRARRKALEIYNKTEGDNRDEKK